MSETLETIIANEKASVEIWNRAGAELQPLILEDFWGEWMQNALRVIEDATGIPKEMIDSE